MNRKTLFHKVFTLVVVGQIISLFGNAILRFALPLYLLNQTHSAALFGIVSACSFIPMIILSPIGGIIADRVNKRNIMVILDFGTAALVGVLTLLMGSADLVPLLIVSLMILYGIQGTYQPAVQASIPSLIAPDKLMPANAVINLVSSLAGLIGPVIGGAAFGFWGMTPILLVSIGCFLTSAIMEMFIHIPFEKKKKSSRLFSMVMSDLKESASFIKNKKPVIAKVTWIIAAINFFFSSVMIIGLPVIITQTLGFDETFGNQLYGYCQGSLAGGGLAGGLLAGMLSKKFSVSKSHNLLYICSLLLIPISIALMLKLPAMITYIIILVCCFVSMASVSIFVIQMTSYLQLITPSHLIGKTMALVMCLCMCAHPLGQATYGALFETFPDKAYIFFLCAALISGFVSRLSKTSFRILAHEALEEKSMVPIQDSVI